MGLFIRRITLLFVLLTATQTFSQTSLMVLDIPEALMKLSSRWVPKESIIRLVLT